MNSPAPTGATTTGIKPSRNKRGMLIAAAVAVLVIVAVLSAWIATTVTKTPSAPTTQDTVVTGVAAGSGGSGRAVDGITKIGYPSSCTGAVQAASDYETTLDVYKPASDQAFIKVINQVFASPVATTPFLKNSAEWNAKGYLREPQQTWGGAYKLESCTPAQSASVVVYSCYIGYSTLNKTPESGYTDCDPIRATLSWAGNDWKLNSLGEIYPQTHEGMPKTFTFQVNVGGPRPPGVTAAQWAKITAPDEQGPITGWVDFTNAHR